MLYKIRVNIKSLAAEAKIIRGEKKRYSKSPFIVSGLDSHRVSVLKPEARLANLVYGFLKKYPRSKIEKTFKKEVDAKRLLDKIHRFSQYLYKLEDIQNWLKT